MTSYSKPYRTIEEQIALLKSRGLIITDEQLAATYLSRVGYYRLSGYWHVFRCIDPNNSKYLLDTFYPNTELRTIIDLYIFDKLLRMILLDAIERIEIALRVDVALKMGKHDPEAHLNPKLVDPINLQVTKEKPQSNYQTWLKDFRRAEMRSREIFVKAFKDKYPKSELPLWMAVEIWDFGLLSKYLAMLNGKDVQAIGRKYGMPDRPLFTSTTRSISLVRNICAHHGRLWNRVLTDQPRYPKKEILPLLTPALAHRDAMQRLFGTICLIRCYMLVICPNSQWHNRFIQHMQSFPTSPYLSPSMMGIVEGWQKWPLWQTR